MNQKLQQKKILLFAVGGVIVIVMIVVAVIVSNRKSPSYTKVTVDKDTGETILDRPNQTPEAQAGGRQLTILGSSELINNGITQDQYTALKTILITYAKTTLKNKYTEVAFLPKTIQANDATITGQLRLGSGDTKVAFTITITELKYVQLKIVDSGQNGGNYDSGKVEITPPVSENVQDNDTGDGDPALIPVQ